MSHDPPLADAVEWSRGHFLEDFSEGQTFEHHWGRTFTEADGILFCNLTLHFTPLYFNREYARAAGHRDLVINPWLVFLTVFGLSVEDLSEAGRGAFLGVEDLTFQRALYPGDTVVARSTVLAIRDSGSRPGYGIVTWRTEGLAGGEPAIRFQRTNLVIRRSALADGEATFSTEG